MVFVARSRGSLRLVQLKWRRVYANGIYCEKREIEYHGDSRIDPTPGPYGAGGLEGGSGSKATLWTPERGLGRYALVHCYSHNTCFFLSWSQLLPPPPTPPCIVSLLLLLLLIISHVFGLYWFTIAIPTFHYLLPLKTMLFSLFCCFNFWARGSNWYSSFFHEKWY